MIDSPCKIDVHHHMMPKFYADSLQCVGINDSAGFPFPEWSPENSLALMENKGISKAYLSVANPGVDFGDAGFARELARQINEYGAQLKQDCENFGFFAIVSQNHTEDAINEVCYAMDELNADGIVLLSSVNGQYIGNPEQEPLMAELNRRNAVVFVHPTTHKSAASIDVAIPHAILEFVFDTTRAVANLIVSGTKEKYPNINFILSHAGGTIPYLTWRLSLLDIFADKEACFPRGVQHCLKQFFYDTALSASPFMWGSIKELVGADRILFGSDFPFAPEPIVAMEVDGLKALGLTETERAAIDYRNAKRLLR